MVRTGDTIYRAGRRRFQCTVDTIRANDAIVSYTAAYIGWWYRAPTGVRLLLVAQELNIGRPADGGGRAKATWTSPYGRGSDVGARRDVAYRQGPAAL